MTGQAQRAPLLHFIIIAEQSGAPLLCTSPVTSLCCSLYVCVCVHTSSAGDPTTVWEHVSVFVCNCWLQVDEYLMLHFSMSTFPFLLQELTHSSEKGTRPVTACKGAAGFSRIPWRFDLTVPTSLKNELLWCNLMSGSPMFLAALNFQSN